MSISIRPLAQEDEPQWRQLWAFYLAFYESSVPETVSQKTFARLLDPQRPQQDALVAEQDGKLVGFVHFIFHAHNWRVEDVCYLQDLYVDRSVRGAGVGRVLIEAVYAAADKRGCPSVYWLTQDFNATARTLYDRIAKLTPFVKYQR